MSCHRIFNKLVDSNLRFPGLNLVSEGIGDYEFRLLAHSPPELSSAIWFHEWKSEERVWARLGKLGTEFVIRFPDKACFLITADKREISCYPESEITIETVSHLFLDQVLPCLLGGDGAVVFHAAAAAFSAGAAVFVGVSGRGKSTLSADLSSHGIPLLTDDCLLLQQTDSAFQCVPSYPGIRLWPESTSELFGAEVQGAPMADYSSKRRFNGDNAGLVFVAESAPLKKIYLLAEPDEAVKTVSITPINRRDAFLELQKHIYRLDITDLSRIGEEFDFMAKVVEATQPCWLNYPRNFAALAEVRQALLKDMEF